ncbi:unnamed protein product [Protopolystoma xenopodis]|uniref:Uncharacterized protein n=1 Tax=Protopolystoma xenopodis TaxID=117903 RepID=A0A448XDH5_9PLAT|nr:unnamed protein product [Protopolystoma xenopodis]
MSDATYQRPQHLGHHIYKVRLSSSTKPDAQDYIAPLLPYLEGLNVSDSGLRANSATPCYENITLLPETSRSAAPTPTGWSSLLPRSKLEVTSATTPTSDFPDPGPNGSNSTSRRQARLSQLVIAGLRSPPGLELVALLRESPGPWETTRRSVFFPSAVDQDPTLAEGNWAMPLS